MMTAVELAQDVLDRCQREAENPGVALQALATAAVVILDLVGGRRADFCDMVHETIVQMVGLSGVPKSPQKVAAQNGREIDFTDDAPN